MSKKILIIDDTEANLYLIRYILEQNNYIVIQAMNGPDGLRLAKQENPDLVLTDVLMPGMNGIEVAREMRQMPCCKNIPIIAITALVSENETRMIQETNFNGIIEKPIIPVTFIKEINKYLSQSN